MNQTIDSSLRRNKTTLEFYFSLVLRCYYNMSNNAFYFREGRPVTTQVSIQDGLQTLFETMQLKTLLWEKLTDTWEFNVSF